MIFLKVCLYTLISFILSFSCLASEAVVSPSSSISEPAAASEPPLVFAPVDGSTEEALPVVPPPVISESSPTEAPVVPPVDVVPPEPVNPPVTSSSPTVDVTTSIPSDPPADAAAPPTGDVVPPSDCAAALPGDTPIAPNVETFAVVDYPGSITNPANLIYDFDSAFKSLRIYAVLIFFELGLLILCQFLKP